MTKQVHWHVAQRSIVHRLATRKFIATIHYLDRVKQKRPSIPNSIPLHASKMAIGAEYSTIDYLKQATSNDIGRGSIKQK